MRKGVTRLMASTPKGFTLIELLVVIAIIGILAGIVLASLGTARSKGNDAKTKEQLSNLRTAMEVYYSTNNNYGAASSVTNNCAGIVTPWTDSGVNPLVSVGNYPAGTALACYASGGGVGAATGWAVSASLSAAGTFWCVDSTGASESRTTAVPAPGTTSIVPAC